MAQVVIENPIFNSPYEKPARHFRLKEREQNLRPCGGRQT